MQSVLSWTVPGWTVDLSPTPPRDTLLGYIAVLTGGNGRYRAPNPVPVHLFGAMHYIYRGGSGPRCEAVVEASQCKRSLVLAAHLLAVTFDDFLGSFSYSGYKQSTTV